MKNKTIIFFIITILIALIPICVCAATYQGIDTSISIGQGSVGVISSSQSVTNKIVGAIHTIGTFVAVGALMIIGIRYMISSVEGKASMKGVMGYYVVGAIFVLATVNVVKWIYNIINSL